MITPNDSPKKNPKYQHNLRWTAELGTIFIDHLLEHGNVTRAAEAVRYSRSQLYNIRNDDAAFAARWDAVIEDAKVHAREAIVLRAAEELERAQTAPMSVKDIIAVLKFLGGGQRAAIRPLDPEAARAEILEMLLAIKRGREGEARAA